MFVLLRCAAVPAPVWGGSCCTRQRPRPSFSLTALLNSQSNIEPITNLALRPPYLQVPGFAGSVSFITSMTKAFCSGDLLASAASRWGLLLLPASAFGCPAVCSLRALAPAAAAALLLPLGR